MNELKDKTDKVEPAEKTGSAEASTKMSVELATSTQKQFINPASAGAADSTKLTPASVGKDGSLTFGPEANDNTPIKLQNFDSVVKTVLQAIDPSGRVTKDELKTTMENPAFKGQDAQVLAALYMNYDELSKLTQNSDELGKGLSADDVAKFSLEKISDSFNMNSWAKDNFDKYAVNGTLTIEQIKEAINAADASPEDSTILRNLKKYYSEIAPEHQNAGINKTDLDSFLKKTIGSPERALLYNEMTSDFSRTSKLGEGQNLNDNLFSSKNLLESITPNAVQQGFMDDCFFAAPLASLAKTDPQTIADFIKDNKDGTYTVTFKGAPDEPLTVKAPTEAELGLYAGGSQYGTWAAVMEKAFGQYRLNHAAQFGLAPGNSPTPEEGANGEGYSTDTFQLLTGKVADYDRLSHDPTKPTNETDVANLLTRSLNDSGKPLTAAIYGDNSGHGKNPSLQNSHEYSVLSFTPDGKGSGTVTLQNPLGGKNDGIIELSLKDFTKDFDAITTGN